jgi:hypothetical protein
MPATVVTRLDLQTGHQTKILRAGPAARNITRIH